MKSSMHLLYGIIIGILLFASTGSYKKDKQEFERKMIFHLGTFDKSNVNTTIQIDRTLTKLRENWTIIDFSTSSGVGGTSEHFVLVGK